jgi:glucokinase
VPRFGAVFDDALFRRRFADKGRFHGYLAAIPCWVITAAAPALIGASRALDSPQ